MASVGTLKFYNRTKGYGFIKLDGADKDIFVHASALKESGVEVDDERNPVVGEGDRFEFEVADTAGKGPRAVKVKALN